MLSLTMFDFLLLFLSNYGGYGNYGNYGGYGNYAGYGNYGGYGNYAGYGNYQYSQYSNYFGGYGQ
jgi:hypothetical protein